MVLFTAQEKSILTTDHKTAAFGAGVVQSAAPLVEAVELTRIYPRGAETVRALDGVSFSLQAGEFVAIVGPSGAGKSTLLHLLGCMDAPTSGSLTLHGRSTHGLSDTALTRMRRELVGFVFQHFGLLPTLTVAENVVLPTLFSRRHATKLAAELLERVGMAHRSNHRPHELSGGEMQRAAIARALINSPRLLMADEPTGNLDSANGEAILNLFQELNREGLTVVVVTHNEGLAASAQRRLILRDGKLASDTHTSEGTSPPAPLLETRSSRDSTQASARSCAREERGDRSFGQ